MKKNVLMLCMATLCCLLGNFARAGLLGLYPSYPQINFVNNDAMALSYDPVSQMFTVNATPYSYFVSESDTGTFIVTNNTLQIQLGTDGTLVSGTNGFVLAGQFTEVLSGVTNNYSGVLLQGDVIAFGYQYEGGAVNQFDIRVQLTAGIMKPLFDCGNDLAVTFTSEQSTFTGTFTNAFNGAAQGYCGPEDTTPPNVTCPPISEVVTTPTIDPATGNPGFIITYPSPVVTDNCDPEPASFSDTPSGSIVDLNPGDQLTVTCYGIDVSGNSGYCSFTVTMGVNNGVCALGFTNGGCPPVTLPTDLNSCSATFAFPLPLATNCNGQVFVSTATAVSETGTTIPLTTLANGSVQGIFPRTFTTNGNVITFTASDGQGNNVVEQCQVFVKDTQAPTIACMNQTATFKPILTNALSCIEADFNKTCIVASNYIWFSSVIQPTYCLNRNTSFTVHVFDQTIQLFVDNTNITLNVPDAYVIFSNGVPTATTIFTNGEWITYSKLSCSGNTFVSGLAWQVPFNLNNLIGNCWGRDHDDGCFRRHVSSATWCARFAVDTPGIALQWQWGAVVEKTLTNNFNTLCVKPVDDNRSSCWANNDPAGSCENYKSWLIPGACGRGRDHDNQPDCTGILSRVARCNLGKGIVCEGPVNFQTPMAADNCDDSVTVTCNLPSGSIFGPGSQTITCTAVDSSGNSNQCSFTLTVLPPVQVVFDWPACDNIVDNAADPDAGYDDMNCPDDPSTPQYITCFNVGDKILHQCRLLDCNGNDVTASLAPCVTMHIDVTERSGCYTNSLLVNDMTASNSASGTPGCIMVPGNGVFTYTLDTAGYPARTLNTSTFFRACVWVDYNTSPGVPIGMEDVLLQSK